MERSLRIVFSLTVAGSIFAPSCAEDDAVRVGIVTRLTAPRRLLDRAARLDVRVLEGEVTCDESTGTVAFPSGEDAATEVANRELGQTGCEPDAKFCGDVTVPISDAVRVFSVRADDGAGETIAVGCTSSKVEEATLALTIRMYRYLAPAVCGDGTIQPTEQCEPGGTPLCDDRCQSNEILLSVGAAGNHTDTGTGTDKTEPFFLWPTGTGDEGRFFALFTDKKTGATNNTDVGIRVMADDLAALSSPPALAKGSIFMSSGGAFPPEPAPLRQSMPEAAFASGKTWIVFQDDNSPGSNGLDIHLRSLNDVLASDQGADPLTINGAGSPPTGEAGIQASPSIAAGSARLFIAWEDAGSKIVGRTLTPPDTLGPQNDISSGTNNGQPSVAATPSGFVTVWKSGTGIRLRALNGDGTPRGADTAVSDGGSGFGAPCVASLPDGRFAVAWTAGSDVFVQRYDAKGAKLDGDQARPIDDPAAAGDKTGAAIAGTPAAGGSYAVAWVASSTGHVHARFLGGSGGFLFNNVNGQAGDFQASRVDGHTRAGPTIGVGGAGPFVAIGWQDTDAGIVARRFPLPSE